ncbi:MAG: tyrosine-type recombinase/integrase [Thermoleophilaceae bacterium]
MSSTEASPRRSYGAGRLYTRTDLNGRETFYGSWWIDGRRVNRRLGLKRTPGERDGLTRAQAEAELRRLMATVRPAPGADRGMTVRDLSMAYRAHLEALGRKRTTLAGVESVQRVWIDRVLGDRSAASVTTHDVEDLMRSMRTAGVGAKSVRNYVGTLSAMFRYAHHPRRRWVAENPCDALELPPADTHAEIHYLTLDELGSLADAAVAGPHEQLDRTLYLTAAMTGLRQGELIALRWLDVDWLAQRIRVRRNHVLGEFDTPKSRRGSRSVPMTTRVVGALDGLHRASRWQEDEHLVFAEPDTGEPLRRGALMRRYRRALKAAQLEPTHRFHDLRHTFGTAMAGAGVPMRTLQEWMGHRDIATTQRYADYAPNPHEVEMVEAAFGAQGPVRGPILSESEGTSEHLRPMNTGDET